MLLFATMFAVFAVFVVPPTTVWSGFLVVMYYALYRVTVGYGVR